MRFSVAIIQRASGKPLKYEFWHADTASEQPASSIDTPRHGANPAAFVTRSEVLGFTEEDNG
jgi:hypothetical protein